MPKTKSQLNKERYQRLRSNSQCVACAVKVNNGKARCEACLDKQAKEFRDGYWAGRRSYKPGKFTIITSLNK